MGSPSGLRSSTPGVPVSDKGGDIFLGPRATQRQVVAARGEMVVGIHLYFTVSLCQPLPPDKATRRRRLSE